MAYEYRRPVFNLSGTLSNGCTALDTSLASTVFTSLPTDYSSALYLPLVLANDTQGKSEVVWVTGHSSAAASVTVVRGREGTSAQAFSAGDVVRCSPTIRDVVPAVSTRSALPGDGHYGLRMLILDEGQVVERTSAGWNDSAPLEGDPSRKHRWNQSGASLAANSTTLVSGLSGGQLNSTGNYATMSNGSLYLNTPGDWVVMLTMYGTSQNNRNQGMEMRWPNGAFPGNNSTLYDYRGAIGGTSPAGNALGTITWEGYVSAAQAALPISMYTYSTVALVGCVYDVYAEYKGR